MRLISGVIAAGGAFAVGELARLFGVDSLPGRFGVFLLVYIIVAVVAERAMRSYGNGAKA